ncbi:MAG: hypothetical protein ACRDRX_03585 [Pseudonocardiaceae bacterium]
MQTRPRLGGREITSRALADGSITVIPEYSGNLLHSLDPASPATTADGVYAALQPSPPQGLQVLTPSGATLEALGSGQADHSGPGGCGRPG